MIYRTVKLYDLMKENVGKEIIDEILADFSCPLNDDVEDFVHSKAYDFERVGLSRTYLIYALVDGNPILCGIYSLTPGAIELDNSLTKKERRKLLGTTYPIGKNIKTLLIGQLSKNYKNNNDRYITGEILLELAFERIRKVDVCTPSTVVHVDCKDIKPLRYFYERHGFTCYQKSDHGLLVYLIPTGKVINVDYKEYPKSKATTGKKEKAIG